jgi:hypothetical protein
VELQKWEQEVISAMAVGIAGFGIIVVETVIALNVSDKPVTRGLIAKNLNWFLPLIFISSLRFRML